MERGICKLCPMDKDLQDSHFLGKVVYQKLSEPSLKNPTPVMITRDTAKQSPIQIRDHVSAAYHVAPIATSEILRLSSGIFQINSLETYLRTSLEFSGFFVLGSQTVAKADSSASTSPCGFPNP
jgi:hypothetical protein